jgi:hypothetical protein
MHINYLKEQKRTPFKKNYIQLISLLFLSYSISPSAMAASTPLSSEAGYGCLELTPGKPSGEGFIVTTWKKCDEAGGHQKWDFSDSTAKYKT